ncbi:MAG: hypothetical protein KDH20_11340 [Rhodocyclaceae bacterium]|nr:hypothetical protein [Rhodocyclaceae bacterium]
MRMTTRTAAPLLLTLLLTACGGGGGGSGDGGSPSVGTTEVSLTTDNMETAGSTSVTAADVGTVPPADVSDFVSGARASGTGPASGAIQRLLGQQLLAFASTPPEDVASGITLTRTEACSQAGSVTVTIEDNNGQIDAGDALTAGFSACDNGEGVIDGNLALTLSSLSGDFSPSGSVSGTATFTALRVATANGSVTTTGTMGLSLTQSSTEMSADYEPDNVRYELAGPVRQGTLTVVDGVITVIETAGTTTTALLQIIDADFPRFAGRLVLTSTRMIVTAPDGEIQSGSIDVAGANGSVTLTFLGDDQVLLELDADDDATAEVSRTLSLSALELTAF